MISNTKDNKTGTSKVQNSVTQMLKKQETLENVLNTVKQNPKFIKLLVYSMNSLESFVSPPNREIRVNAKIIIKIEGVGTLKAISMINITNEEIVRQVGSILWKVISFNDFIDQELAKLFADAHGHEAVIEILLCNQSGQGAKPYIKILNGLVHVPQLVQKLIESGLIETVKLVNDIYVDDQDIITVNFDTMKKISNLKMGREFLIKKNLIPNLIKNIKISATQKDPKAVISGFSIVDNISRSDDGKEALKRNNAVQNISQILDFFENDDRVLKMGAKIYSKISKPEDMIKEIENLEAIYQKGDYSELNLLEKSLVLISNFMLVDDICKLLCEETNLNLLINLFDAICKVDLEDKSSEYVKTYVLLNKYFMIVFNRIFNAMPNLFEGHVSLYENINSSVSKIWENTKKIIKKGSEEGKIVIDLINPFIRVFKEFFSSYTDLIDKYSANQGLDKIDVKVIKYLLNLIFEACRHYQLDEKANYATSRLLKIANKLADEEIRGLLEKLFSYIKGVINTSEFQRTITNNLEVLLSILTNSNTNADGIFNLSPDNTTPTMKEQILPIIVNFMNTKPKFRAPNHLNLNILELLMSGNNFIENYNKILVKHVNLINPIISVMARHIYETSTVLKIVSTSEAANKTVEEFLPDEKMEINIYNLGAKLLEKLVDENELRKMIKIFKDNANSFNPASATADSLTNLEFNLLYFLAIMRIKNYFLFGLSDILEILKMLLKKEISFIEAFKKDKNNEKNSKFEEIVNSSSKRINIEIAILKLLNENCNRSYEETGNDAYIQPIKEVIQLILEIFDKSSDSSNLIDLLGHLQKNIEFLMENEGNLNLNSNTPITESRRQSKAFKNVKFEDSVIEKITNVLMNLLRKNPDDENLAESIITTFITLTNKKPETCNFLVKEGCPRLLLQIIDNTATPHLAKLALELIKIISLSSEENLQMVSNQNILEKLHEIHTKFSNYEEITAICDIITNELIKLPGQEAVVSEIIKSNVSEFHENMQNKTFSDLQGKLNVLSNIEKINAFSSNKKQIELLSNDNFMFDLQEAVVATIEDKEVSDVNEKLMQNEIALLKKINEEVKSKDVIDDNKIAAIIDCLLGLMKEKSNFRDIYLGAAKLMSDYFSDANFDIYNKHLKDKLDFAFVDSLFESSENYLDDVEVSKEINNILCNLCLRSEKLADYIVQKGGLSNVMEELKSLVSLNDEQSNNIKLNGLKFLHSLVKEDSNMGKFLKAHGVDLINNIIKNELQNSKAMKEKTGESNYYLTNETFNITPQVQNVKDTNKNSHIVYCLKIINENNKKNLGSFNDPKLFKNVLQLINENYPNKYLFKKGMKTLSKTLSESNIQDNDKKLCTQIILSNVAYNLPDSQIFELSKNIIQTGHLDILLDEEYITLLKDNCEYIQNSNAIRFNELHRLLSFVSLASELNVNKWNTESQVQEPLFNLYRDLLNFYNKSLNISNKSFGCNEGVALALMKLTRHFASTLKSNDLEFEAKLLNIGLNYYKPSNHTFVSEYLKEFNSLYDSIGLKDENGKLSENFVFYLQNIYLRSFDFFDHFQTSIINNNGVVSNIPTQVEENFDEILSNIIIYFKIDQDADIKVSSIKKLSSACLILLTNEKMSCDNLNSKLYSRVKSLWELLYNVTKKDINNVICGTDEVVSTILTKLDEAIMKNPEEEIFRQFYKLISSKLENNNELLEKMLDFLAKDFKTNETNMDSLLTDLEILNNLSKFPIVPKMLLKSASGSSILSAIKSLYCDPNITNQIRNLLSGIFKNLLGNNFNIETAVQQHPDLIKSLVSNLLRPELITETGKETAGAEVDIFVNLLGDSYKLVVHDKELIKEDDILKAVEIYSSEPEICAKLQSIQKRISEINQAKQSEESLKKDKEQCKTLCDYIREMFIQHMSELQSFRSDSSLPESHSNTMFRNSTRLLTTQSAVAKISAAPSQSKMSIISKTLFFNTDNVKIKSPLSCKDNCDIPQSIDQILNLVRKLYNENKYEANQNLKEERTDLINNLLNSLKALSISPDNHKTILEMGLMDLMEKLISDPDKEKLIQHYIDSLDIAKNCTYTESAIPVFLDSSLAEPLVNEVLNLYEKPEMVTNNPEVKQVFFFSNMVFSNLCRFKKGFNYLFTKIGLEKLLSLGKKTSHVDILTAIIEMLVNYLQNHTQEEITGLIKEIISIIAKSLSLSNKTSKLVAGCLNLSGMIYSPEIINEMSRLDLVKEMNNCFDKFSIEPEFLNAILFCLSKISANNVNNSREVLDLGLLKKLKEITKTYIANDVLIENITALYKILVMNNMENIEKFCKNGIVVNVFFCLENYWDKGNQPAAVQIVLNCISCLDCMTISDKAIAYLADTKFTALIFETIDKEQNEIDIIKMAIHCLGNYLYKEVGNNLKNINFEKLLQILISLQKKYYSNSEILININYIAGYLIKIMKEKTAKEKLYMIISGSLKMQDFNVPLIIMTLKLMLDVLTVTPQLIDDVFDDNMQLLFTLLKLYKDNLEIQIHCFKIFALFGKNYIYSYTMVNAGLIDFIKETLESDGTNNSGEKKTRHQIREVIFSLLSILCADVNNAKKISDVIMEKLIKDLKDEAYDQDTDNIIRLVFVLSKHKYCIEPLIQFNGLEAILKILRENTNNVNMILDSFSILSNAAEGNDEYKRMMQTMRVTDLINDIIVKTGYSDKKIEFEGRSLIFVINSTQVKLDQIEDLNYLDIKVENPIKTEVRNFLVNGKIVKMINMKGDVKSMHLSMTQDLLKISGKKPKSKLPPKPKYVIDTSQIKHIIKGHGTEAFKKSKGLFRSIPKAEKCFSIIGPTTVDGPKALNVECENEEDVNKWISYLEIIINYFKKMKTIKSAVIIKK